MAAKVKVYPCCLAWVRKLHAGRSCMAQYRRAEKSIVELYQKSRTTIGATKPKRHCPLTQEKENVLPKQQNPAWARRDTTQIHGMMKTGGDSVMYPASPLLLGRIDRDDEHTPSPSHLQIRQATRNAGRCHQQELYRPSWRPLRAMSTHDGITGKSISSASALERCASWSRFSSLSEAAQAGVDTSPKLDCSMALGPISEIHGCEYRHEVPPSRCAAFDVAMLT